MYEVTEWEMEFAKRLRNLREERVPTPSQTTVGHAVGVKQKVVSSWEVGDKLPTYPHLLQIAKFYEVSTDYLLGITTDRKPKARELTEEEFKQRLFDYLTPDNAPEILERVARDLKSKH